MTELKTKPHEVVMRALMKKHDIIAEIIGVRPVHYVDMPVYGNVGDLLIMQGALAFFDRYKIKVKSRSAYFNFSEKMVRPGDCIVFNGGGNFGDLYTGPQQIREYCIERLRDNRIVILPQTIHYSTETEYLKCVTLFSEHKDLHICVRDEVSFGLAQEMTPNVYLLPDMAHQLYPISFNCVTTRKKLGIFRTDGEKKSIIGLETETVTDWPELLGHRDKVISLIKRGLIALHGAGLGASVHDIAMNIWTRYATGLIADAIDLFAEYEEIVTDRLHGHILAALMDKPHVVYDNSYGKNKGYYEMWTEDSELISIGRTA